MSSFQYLKIFTVFFSVTVFFSDEMFAEDGLNLTWTFRTGQSPQNGVLSSDEFDVSFVPVPVSGTLPFLSSNDFFGLPGKCVELGTAPGQTRSLLLQNTGQFRLSPDMTLEAWVYPKQLKTWNRLLLCWGAGPADYSFHFAIHEGLLSLWVMQEDGQYGICEGGRVDVDMPHHVVGTVKKNVLKPQESVLTLYLDGQKTAAAFFDGTIRQPNQESIGIGDSGTAPNADASFAGYSDEFAILNTALTEQEVKERFDTPERRGMMRNIRERKLRFEQERLASIYDKVKEFGVEEIVYAERNPGRDFWGHYYANFGYVLVETDRWFYGVDGSTLKKLNLRTGTNETLLDDPGGGIRDPQISYDGERILFSYRKRRTHRYHLYEMGIDGGNLRQLTDGDFDDIEPCYLPDGGVAFCSSRCNRYIGCWLVATATLFRMNEDGSDIRQLTSFGIRRKHADRSS